MIKSGDRMRQKNAEQDAQMRNAVCFLLIVFLAVVVVLFTAIFPNHGRNCELVAKKAQLELEKTALHERNEQLRLEIEGLRSDRFYIEAVARKKYKLVGPGEVLLEPAEQSD